ncbi:MAG: fibrobacter succinogenes major paralogous domain-containing protein [Bacteroidales bacterium]
MAVLFTSCNKSDDDKITDIDGNIYTAVTIGSQVWMVENLKATKFNDGTTIPLVIDNTEWSNLRTGACCWYDNLLTNKNPYGALYNWYAVNTGKVCPSGWHVPTINEWTTLITFLGGPGVAGGKLKESGTVHWTSPNEGATNESGFTALGAGYRSGNPTINFNLFGIAGYWWSNTDDTEEFALGRSLWNGGIDANQVSQEKSYGLSIRCIKD